MLPVRPRIEVTQNGHFGRVRCPNGKPHARISVLNVQMSTEMLVKFGIHPLLTYLKKGLTYLKKGLTCLWKERSGGAYQKTSEANLPSMTTKGTDRNNWL